MNEQQYLTSTDPAAMVVFFGERITDTQKRYFVEACRKEFGHASYVPDGRHLDFWARSMALPEELRAEILRDVCGNPFRPIAFHHLGEGEYLIRHPESGRFVLSTLRDPDFHKFADHDPVYGDIDHVQSPAIVRVKGTPVTVLDPAILTWNNNTIPLMIDAMLNEVCNKCVGLGGRWSVDRNGIYHKENDCTNCKGEGRIPRAEPRWADMLIIADALETAGCIDVYLLEHLRSERDGERCPWCEGYGKFNNDSGWSAICDGCSGTGRRKGQHWRGCWAIELLRTSCTK